MEPVYGPGSGYETLLSTQNRCYSQDDIFGTFKTTSLSLVISRRHLCNVPHGIFGTPKKASLVLSRQHIWYSQDDIFGNHKTTSLLRSTRNLWYSQDDIFDTGFVLCLCLVWRYEEVGGKFLGATDCTKNPITLCANTACTFVEGPEECHNKTQVPIPLPFFLVWL